MAPHIVSYLPRYLHCTDTTARRRAPPIHECSDPRRGVGEDRRNTAHDFLACHTARATHRVPHNTEPGRHRETPRTLGAGRQYGHTSAWLARRG